MSFGDDTLDPANNDKPKKSGEFFRQEVLFTEIKEAQKKCPHERLKLVKQDAMLCSNCGALWIR